MAAWPQIVVGMLLKYVNLGSGWRHRLFVLQDGVLRYYKVGAGTAAVVLCLAGHAAQLQCSCRVGSSQPATQLCTPRPPRPCIHARPLSMSYV